jgi:sulfur-oxidizing protein SoxX
MLKNEEDVMRNSTNFFTALGAVALLLGGLAMAPQAVAAGHGKGGEMPSKGACAKATDPIAVGGCLATNRKKGNCMACHTFAGLENTRLQAGDIAPPLVGMKQRFPDKAKLRAQIYDATKANPNTMMPPYGKHGILSDKDIDLITDWAYTL